MIHIRTADLDDIAVIKQLMEENDLNPERIEDSISNCMIAWDNRTPIAAAGFIDNENSALLQFIVVQKARQRESIGDGILKSLLNFADAKGIRDVFVYTKNELAPFFKKVGFQEANPDQIHTAAKRFHIDFQGENDIWLHVALPEFFKTACRAKQHQ